MMVNWRDQATILMGDIAKLAAVRERCHPR